MDAVVAHSEASIEKGSSSFRMAARLFGRGLREDVWQFYAWCRHCDDEIDGQDHGGSSAPLSDAERRRRLARLRRMTCGALAGEPQYDAAFIAFQRVARRYALPRQWPLEMLDGFAMDVEGRRFETSEETLRYCWGVAGVVGAMMAQMMGARDDWALERAQDLGLAFQLTNICRDVREDAGMGRIYLPAAALRAAGVEPEADAVLDPRHGEAVFAVVRAHLDLAEGYYRSARAGLRALPFRAALAVAVARGVYREIGRRIARGGPRTLDSRMAVPRPAMLWQLACGSAVALWSRVERLAPAPRRAALWSRF